MADRGAKFAKTGDSVSTAATRDLVMSTAKNSLKLKHVQQANITISGGFGSLVIPHGLSFPPIVIAYIRYGSTLTPIPSTSASITDIFGVYVDSTNIVFSASSATDGDYTIFYYESETESAS